MEELNHHGIKGMKWGVRRTPEQLGHKKFKKKVRAAMDRAQVKLDEHKKLRAGEAEVRKAERAKRAEIRKEEKARRAEKEKADREEREAREALMRKKPSQMTDEELRARYSRLKLEDDYATLAARVQSREPQGVGGWLKDQMAKSAKSFGERTFNYLVGAAFDKITAPKPGGYDIDDTSKASLKKLSEAANWYDAKNRYEEARSKSQKSVDKPESEATYRDRKLSDISDDELSDIASRLKKEAAIKRDLDYLSGKSDKKKKNE